MSHGIRLANVCHDTIQTLLRSCSFPFSTGGLFLGFVTGFFVFLHCVRRKRRKKGRKPKLRPCIKSYKWRMLLRRTWTTAVHRIDQSTARRWHALSRFASVHSCIVSAESRSSWPSLAVIRWEHRGYRFILFIFFYPPDSFSYWHWP